MGHQGYMFEGTNKAELEKRVKQCRDADESGKYIEGIVWNDRVYNTEEEAEDYLYSVVSKTYYWQHMGARYCEKANKLEKEIYLRKSKSSDNVVEKYKAYCEVHV